MKCGGKLTRLIGTGSGFIFKGSGFYITDYRSESYKKKASEEKGKTAPPSKDSSSKEKKSDA